MSQPYGPAEAKASVDEMVAKMGVEGATLDLLKAAHSCLRGYIPRDSGLLLEIREMLARRGVQT